jgi:uncharacterized protein YhaN
MACVKLSRTSGAALPLLLLIVGIIAALSAALFATLKAVDEYQKRVGEQKKINTLERECDALKEEIARYKMISQEPEAAAQLLREQEQIIDDLCFELERLEVGLKGLETGGPSDAVVFKEMWRQEGKATRLTESRGNVRSLGELERELKLREEMYAIDAQLRGLAENAPEAERLMARRQAILKELGRIHVNKGIGRMWTVLRRAAKKAIR